MKHVILVIAFAIFTAGCASAPVCGTMPQPQAGATGGPESAFSLLFGLRKPVCVPEGHRVIVPSAGGWQEVCPCEEPTGMQTITLTVPKGAVEVSRDGK